MYDLLTKYKDYSIATFNIEREQKKPRKDLAMFSEVRNQIWYMYDELFTNVSYNWDNINDIEEIKTILSLYLEKYLDLSDKDTWFAKMKELADELGYAKEVKLYKENPENYKGHIGDVSMVLRVALTSLNMTPDLYEIMKLFGKERISERFSKIN